AVLGIILLFIFSLPYLFATGIPSLTAIRFLHGLAFGLVSTAISTMVADSLPIRHFGEGMGYFGLTTSLSMSLAPILGLFLTEKFDYQGLFIAVCLMAALAFFISLPVKDRHSQEIIHPQDDTRKKTDLFEKTALSPSVVMFFLAVVYGAVLLYAAVYASDIGVSGIGWFFTVTALMMMVSRPVSGRWTDNGGANSVILIGHCSILIAMLLIASTNNLAGFIFAGLLVGLGFGFCMPTLQALAVRFAEGNRRGAAVSTFFIFFDLGFGFGTVFWGHVAAWAGYRQMYLATLLPLALGGLIYYWFMSARIRATGGHL
ncbi:MAG: MFS transporter, partial [Peptococcaceae bacterium]|nr:MFS transporter [Peptococcaceae bacterium]